jgi:hypothetical protein
MFLLPVSCTEFARRPMVASITGAAYRRRKTNNHIEHIREYNSAIVLSSMGQQIKSLVVNGPYCFRIHGEIHHLVS